MAPDILSWDTQPMPQGVAALLSSVLGYSLQDCISTHLPSDQHSALQRASSPALRRVASAPSLKVSSSGQSPCPATTSSSSSVCKSTQPAPVTCSSCGSKACRCLEVYVVSRAFSEFGGALFSKLSPEMRCYMVDIGICHYMTVFRTPDGRFVQFDFGPQGGDVQKARGPLATLLRRARWDAQQANSKLAGTAAAAPDGSSSSSSSRVGGMVHSASSPALPVASLELSGAPDAAGDVMSMLDSSRQAPKGVVGEIRERTLEELPAAHLYVGRTQLTLQEIRCYNSTQRLLYELHQNDCRHYVNNLVHYATGVERSTQHLKRHHFRSRHAGRWLPHGWFIETSQLITDVGNWGHVKAGTAATLLAMTGRATLAHLKALSLPLMPLLKSMPLFAGAPAAAVPASAALLLKRPLAAGGVAAAGSAAAASGLRAAQPGSGSSTGGAEGQALGHFGLGERLGAGIRAAAMALRRQALRGSPYQQQRHQLEQGAAAAAQVGGAPRRWFAPWLRGTPRHQQQQQPVLLGAAAPAVLGDASGALSLTSSSSRGQQWQQRQPRWRFGPLDWGSHVRWLGGRALRATSGIVAAASRRVGFRQGLTQQQAAVAGLALGEAGMSHPGGRGVTRRDAMFVDPVWGCAAGSSNSSLRGGGSRQTLHLPVPRLTWFARNKRNMVA